LSVGISTLTALLFGGDGALRFNLYAQRLALRPLMELPAALAVLLCHFPQSSRDE